ncbi:RICIN domain-containing protein [Spirillospora sp. NPDC048911]|uniref:RICIN domain-containing protein n=1 Tax=Spirillospora sp. NPDC048911 TaxID=3364527 RepID=UPI0037151FF8
MSGLAAAVVVVVAGTGGTAAATPSAKAAPLPVFIQNFSLFQCLDQHFDAAGQPTVLVFGWPRPCHWQGNQQWRFYPDPRYNNAYKIVNERRGWCLSHAGGRDGRVYAELCVDHLKQIWVPRVWPSTGRNRLQNLWTNQCLALNADIDVFGFDCDERYWTQHWSWNTIPV